MERVERTTKRSGTVVDARMSLALWLRAGRAQRSMSLEDVAKVTKIQVRILERLEAGRFDGLPAEVFVRGFLRSFARCVGLDEAEVLERYNLIASSGTKEPHSASASARGLVDSMSDLAPRAASRATGPVMLVQAPTDLVVDTWPPMAVIPASSMDAVKVEDVVAAAAEPLVLAPAIEVPIAADVIEVSAEASEPTKSTKTKSAKTKSSKSTKTGGGRKRKVATGTPFEPTPVVVAAVDDVALAPIVSAEIAQPVDVAVIDVAAPVAVVVAETEPLAPLALGPFAPTGASVDVVLDEPVIDAEPAVSGFWAPKMPPPATTSSVPWRRPSMTTTSATSLVPTLVIDDSDPEGAERVLEGRAASKISTTNAQRRSFLPPILLDREDRSARQGGLTLAVILLLIAATITLSYLMRRPSSSGDGITMADTPTSVSIG